MKSVENLALRGFHQLLVTLEERVHDIAAMPLPSDDELAQSPIGFPVGELPPVNGFWSLTLYNKEHFFHPNKLNRFSLGTKNKDRKLGEDGSLTIYVQPESPGADKESNWLPAPADADYSLYIRAYWPKEPATNGEWVPPTITPQT